MKKGVAVLAISLSCLLNGLPSMAQQTDPALTATVILQTEELKNIHKNRKSTQEKIIAAETAVTVAPDRVHKVENKMLNISPTPRGRCRICIR